jgi:protein-tyrosine-phosphatase
MAEALLDRLSQHAVAVVSAGSHPRPLHPLAVAAMRERGLDISGNRSKHLDEFACQPFDFVITLCDRVREVCPEFPGETRAIHWSIPDPAADPAPTLATFHQTADELERRIRFLLPLIHAAHQPKEAQLT